MSGNVVLGLALASLLVSLLSAIGATALRWFSRHELVEILGKQTPSRDAEELLECRDSVALSVETLRVAASAAFVLLAGFSIWQQAVVGGVPNRTVTVLVSSFIAVLALLAAEIWLPWAMVRVWGKPFVRGTWKAWRLVSYVLWPLIAVARLIDALLQRVTGRGVDHSSDESFEEEIRTIVHEGQREGLLEEEEREMIEGVIDLRDAEVSEIMTPRTDMVCMHIGLPLAEVLQFVIQSSHTRIPVYDKNRDDIVGVLYIRDLLAEMAKGPEVPLKSLPDILRQPQFVPETKPVTELIREFQRTRNHMAVVLDEYGGVSGLVTIEDALEEIVGEIVDEYDQDLDDGIQQIDEHAAEALARVHIDEINDRLKLDFPEDGEFDTIGGFVFHELGRIPKAGDAVTWNNVRITVLDVTRRRVERVRIELLTEQVMSDEG